MDDVVIVSLSRHRNQQPYRIEVTTGCVGSNERRFWSTGIVCIFLIDSLRIGCRNNIMGWRFLDFHKPNSCIGVIWVLRPQRAVIHHPRRYHHRRQHGGHAQHPPRPAERLSLSHLHCYVPVLVVFVHILCCFILHVSIFHVFFFPAVNGAAVLSFFRFVRPKIL